MSYELRIHFGDHDLRLRANERAELQEKCRELTTEGSARTWIDVQDKTSQRTYTVNAKNVSYVEIVQVD